MNATPPCHPVPVSPDERAQERDRFHLMLVSIFYYIASGITFLGVLLGAVYLVFGWFIGSHPDQFNQSGSQPPIPLDVLLSVLGGAIMVGSVVVAGLLLLSARAFAGRKWVVLSYIMAGLVCLSIPFGTGMGIYTFLVLSRPGVRGLYAEKSRTGR